MQLSAMVGGMDITDRRLAGIAPAVLPLRGVEFDGSRLRIGALAQMSEIAAEPVVPTALLKGLGELPATGVAPAIPNAVHHATGRRIGDLPIRPEMLIRFRPRAGETARSVQSLRRAT